MILNTIHNIRHYMRLMEQIRAAVRENRFGDFAEGFLRKKLTQDKT